MKRRWEQMLKSLPLEVLALAVLFLLSLFVFSIIVHEAVFEKEDLFDQNVILFFRSHSSPQLIGVMETITFFGSTTFLLPAYLVIIAWQCIRGRYSYAIDTAIIAVTSTLMMFGLKAVFHRHRPDLPIIKGITGYSFPSGHSLSSFIFCTILGYLVTKSSWPGFVKTAAIVLLCICPLAIGISRIVLNVHYATDVIGGFCLAIVWVILSFAVLRRIRRSKNVITATQP